MSKRAFVEATSNKPLPAHVRSIGSLTTEPLPSGTKIRVAGRLVYYHDEAGLLLLVAHDGARGLWVDPSLCFEPPYGAIHDHSEGTMWMAMGELEIVGRHAVPPIPRDLPPFFLRTLRLSSGGQILRAIVCKGYRESDELDLARWEEAAAVTTARRTEGDKRLAAAVTSEPSG